jgi:glycerol-3-phosphate dehydrogenase
MPSEIGVVGAGAWGTALAKLLADKGQEITLWCHGDESFRDIAENRENRAYLPAIHSRNGFGQAPDCDRVAIARGARGSYRCGHNN